MFEILNYKVAYTKVRLQSSAQGRKQFHHIAKIANKKHTVLFQLTQHCGLKK